MIPRGIPTKIRVEIKAGLCLGVLLMLLNTSTSYATIGCTPPFFFFRCALRGFGGSSKAKSNAFEALRVRNFTKTSIHVR